MLSAIATSYLKGRRSAVVVCIEPWASLLFGGSYEEGWRKRGDG